MYDAPDEAIEAFKHKLMASTGINDKTILKPVSGMMSGCVCVCAYVLYIYIYMCVCVYI